MKTNPQPTGHKIVAMATGPESIFIWSLLLLQRGNGDFIKDC